MAKNKPTDLIVDVTALTSVAQALVDGASVSYNAEGHFSQCALCGSRVFGPALDVSMEHRSSCLVSMASLALNVQPQDAGAQGVE